MPIKKPQNGAGGQWGNEMRKISAQTIPSAYAQIMREIKDRIASAMAAQQAAGTAIGTPSSYFQCEYCYLQIRRCCELVALAVLVAHQEIEDYGTNHFLEAWNAGELFKKLNRLSEQAFPQPVKEGPQNEEGYATLRLTTKIADNRDRIVKMYADCGDKMHAGSLKGLLKHGSKKYDIDNLKKMLTFMVNLLKYHIVVLPDMTLMTRMMSPVDGSVECIFVEHKPI
jgi:hypothetical protein